MIWMTRNLSEQASTIGLLCSPLWSYPTKEERVRELECGLAGEGGYCGPSCWEGGSELGGLSAHGCKLHLQCQCSPVILVASTAIFLAFFLIWLIAP
jgi:hypothetical protein